MSGYQDAIDLKYGDAWLGVLNGLGQDVADLVGGELTDGLVYGAREISSAVDITLVAGDSVLQAVTMTVTDKAIILPDATTCVKGRPRIVTNAGANGFAVRKNGGAELVAAVAAGETYELRLIEGATAAGEWLAVHHQVAAAPEVTDQTARTNIMLNAFRIAVNGGLSVMNMVDGVVDEFEDETGVTTATGATYDSGGDFYQPTPGGYTSDVFNTFTTFTSGDQTISASTYGGGDETYKAVDNAGVAVSSLWQATSWWPCWIKMDFGSGNDVEAMQYTIQSRDGPEPQRTIGTWMFQYSDNDSDWTTVHSQTGVTWTAAQKRTYNGWEAPGAHRYWRIYATGNSSGDYPGIAEWEIMEFIAPSDMTLISEPFTAETAPDQAYLVVWQEDVDSVTLNTDLLAYVSRDDGTTWTQATLAEEVRLATGRILTGTADISGQPAGTSMKWEVSTYNYKELRLHGVGLEWS